MFCFRFDVNLDQFKNFIRKEDPSLKPSIFITCKFLYVVFKFARTIFFFLFDMP